MLECEFSVPNLEAVWCKDNMDIKYAIGLDRCSKKVNGTLYQLIVSDSTLEDTGCYSCLVKLAKTSCNVKVMERPVEVVKPLTDQEVVEKQTATFSCTLSRPRLKVSWYKNNVKLSEDGRIEFAVEGKVYKLIINNAQLDDKATYKIKFEDDAESNAKLTVKGLLFTLYSIFFLKVFSHCFKLKLKDAPNKLKNTLDDKTAVEEDPQAFFEIELIKPISENEDVKWSFNGRKLEKGAKYGVDSNRNKCRLIIKDITLEDEGTYAVDINNTKSSALLIVEGLNFL